MRQFVPKGVRFVKLSLSEVDYPLVARLYLWALRTKWFGFAYHLTIIYGISVCALGTLLIAMGYAVPFGPLVVGWFLLSLGMLGAKYLANLLYWNWLYRLTHRHSRSSAASLQAYIEAEALAHPDRPVDIAAFFEQNGAAS